MILFSIEFLWNLNRASPRNLSNLQRHLQKPSACTYVVILKFFNERLNNTHVPFVKFLLVKIIDQSIRQNFAPSIFWVPTNLRNGTPDSAKYLICGTHQNEPKQLPSLVVIVLNKIEQKCTPEK